MDETELKYAHALRQLGMTLDAYFASMAKIETLTAKIAELTEALAKQQESKK